MEEATVAALVVLHLLAYSAMAIVIGPAVIRLSLTILVVHLVKLQSKPSKSKFCSYVITIVGNFLDLNNPNLIFVLLYAIS